MPLRQYHVSNPRRETEEEIISCMRKLPEVLEYALSSHEFMNDSRDALGEAILKYYETLCQELEGIYTS